MRSRPFDPRRLDVLAFATEGGRLEGVVPVSQLPRLATMLFQPQGRADDDQAAWQAEGELRKPQSLEPQPWLRLRVDATVPLECQRCLAAVAVPLAVDRYFRFVDGEDAAAELDAEADDDVLALPRALDLVVLVEDEMLLALPIVPRHERCPDPLPMPAAADDEEGGAAEHPFAALAALKGRPPGVQ